MSNTETSSKVYFAYTPYYQLFNLETRKYVTDDRAVIAVQRVGDCIHYGVSVCCIGDLWDKAKGRALAQERMEQGFGKACIKPGGLGTKIEKDGEHPVLLDFLNGLTDSVYFKMGGYKRRIAEFNKKNTVQKAADSLEAVGQL